MKAQIHNANLLGAALLCRVASLTGDTRLLAPALKVARYSVARQQADGSWPYGEGDTQRWVDNFHTGYNLCALRDIGRCLNTDEFEPHVRRGFDFYRAHFFRPDGAPRYFHDRTYPIDIHCVAQSIITLIAFRDVDPAGIRLADSVFRWAMLRCGRARLFYYRASIRLSGPHMRWSQAWMLLALAVLQNTSPAARSNRTRLPRSLSTITMPNTYVLVTAARNEVDFTS